MSLVHRRDVNVIISNANQSQKLRCYIHNALWPPAKPKQDIQRNTLWSGIVTFSVKKLMLELNGCWWCMQFVLIAQFSVKTHKIDSTLRKIMMLFVTRGIHRDRTPQKIVTLILAHDWWQQLSKLEKSHSFKTLHGCESGSKMALLRSDLRRKTRRIKFSR